MLGGDWAADLRGYAYLAEYLERSLEWRVVSDLWLRCHRRFVLARYCSFTVEVDGCSSLAFITDIEYLGDGCNAGLLSHPFGPVGHLAGTLLVRHCDISIPAWTCI